MPRQTLQISTFPRIMQTICPSDVWMNVELIKQLKATNCSDKGEILRGNKNTFEEME